MAEFKFPRDPGTDHENPFENERGLNPFADEAQAGSLDPNPYGASAADSLPDQPSDYLAMLPSRSKRIFWFGVSGLMLAVLGIVLTMVGVARSGNWTEGISFGISIQFMGLAVSLPAWILGAADLKAMRAGAMEAVARKQTRIGLVLGISGVSIGVIPVLGWCGLLTVYFWNQ